MFWRVGIARNAVFFRSFVALKARKGRSEKRGGAKDPLPKMSTKFAPRLRARTIWKSKSLKTDGLGTFLEVQSAMRFAWQAQWFRALWCRCLKPPTPNPWKGCKFQVTEVLFAVIISRGGYRTSYASAQLFRGRRSTFKASAWKSLKRIVILRPRVWSTCHFWKKSRTKASFLSFKASFLKEVSQKSFVFELQSFIFEGSLAEMLRFWASKLHFWRKSRRNASFLSFKASFWRKSRRKASFDKIIWITHQLTTKSLELQIILHPNHLNLKSIDNQLI